MGQFSAPNYEQHDEQDNWSPNDEIDPDLLEPEDFGIYTRLNNDFGIYTPNPEEPPF